MFESFLKLPILEQGLPDAVGSNDASRDDKSRAEHADDPAVSSANQQNRSTSQKHDFKHDAGPRSVAHMRAYDRRFNFYPAFFEERSMVLDFRAEQIFTLGNALNAHMEKLKTRYEVTDPYKLPRGNKHRRKFIKQMSRLAEKLDKYNTAMINSKTLNESQGPEGITLLQLQTFLGTRAEGLLPQYEGDDTTQFRTLEPKRGPIEGSVKIFMPLNVLGKWILRPFRSSHDKTEDLTITCYEDANIKWFVGAVLLLGICVFLVVPLALLSFYESNHAVQTVLVLVMCFLISLLARAIETDEARQIILVCGYSAIMSGFLSQS